MFLLGTSILFTLIPFLLLDSITIAFRTSGEYGNHFEGDIAMTPEQLNAIKISSRNGIINTKYRWPNKTVTYRLSPHHSRRQNHMIEHAMQLLEFVSCVKFVERTDEMNYLQFTRDSGCSSELGYRNQVQILNLSAECFVLGTVVHELLHALGFYHMQSSVDRDDYVNIKWENIPEEYEQNFKAYLTTDFGLGYDYLSVMHYGEFAFSENDEPTLTTKDEQYSEIVGQRVGLSSIDIMKINIMYDC